MFFWIRETVGWLLIAAGLYGCWLSLGFLANKLVFEGVPLGFISVFVFRGGIHLIKVATAARVILQANRQRAELTSVRKP